MKTLKLFVITCGLLITQLISAQNEAFKSAMTDALVQLQTAAADEALLTVGARFERIAQAEKDQWTPFYYAAYINIIRSFSMQDANAKDQLLDQAQELLDQAWKLNSDSSEMQVIQGFLYVGKLSVDPMSRGAQYSQLAHTSFHKAMTLNPENPRAYYMEGTTILHTPDFYGGGKVPAKPVLATAIAKYESFKPIGIFYPSWGKKECQQLLNTCQ